MKVLHAKFASVLAVLTALFAFGCATAPERVLSPDELGALDRTVDERAAEDPQGAKRFFARLASSTVGTSIEFHGIALGADGEPVADARVDTIVFDRFRSNPRMNGMTGKVPKAQITGKDGRFRIRARGAGLLVEVSRQGWSSMDGHAQRTYFYAPELMGENEYPLPTRENPAVFRLRRLSSPDALKTISSGAILFDGPSDVLGFSFREPNPDGVAPSRADVVVRLQKRSPSSWTATVRVPGGGIRNTEDVIPTEVPSGGYSEVLTITSAGSSRRDAYAFLRLSDGTYAHARIGIRAGTRNYFIVEGIWNTTGERFLR